jgi:hypothetical protein
MTAAANGAQAEAYADHFIAIHLSELPDGGVYSKLSTAGRANPTNKTLAALEQTSFQGTTLRGLLLEAYAFSTIGQVMLWGGGQGQLRLPLLLPPLGPDSHVLQREILSGQAETQRSGTSQLSRPVPQARSGQRCKRGPGIRAKGYGRCAPRTRPATTVVVLVSVGGRKP